MCVRRVQVSPFLMPVQFQGHAMRTVGGVRKLSVFTPLWKLSVAPFFVRPLRMDGAFMERLQVCVSTASRRLRKCGEGVSPFSAAVGGVIDRGAGRPGVDGGVVRFIR